MFKLILSLFFLLFSSGLAASFKVYDGMLYKNKPNLALYNIKPSKIVYESAIFSDSNSQDIPSLLNIDSTARVIKGSRANVVILDIERWVLRGRYIEESVTKYNKYISSLRKLGLDNMSIGYFGRMPIGGFEASVSGVGSSSYRNWQKDNDRLKNMAGSVDVIYPEIYAVNDDLLAWKRYAIAKISEVRRLAPGKPVVAFLWPRYPEYISSQNLRNKYISVKDWRQQLELMYKIADGVVIWGGWQEQWDPSAPWWQETLRFMKARNIR